MGPEQLNDLLAQCIRYGTVSARDPKFLRVQVRCADTVSGALVSDWLPVMVPCASGDCQYDLPDVGDHVLCLFLPHGREAGFVLGSFYPGSRPPVEDGDKWHRTFKDGTVLEYDRKSHKLTANVQGDVDITSSGGLKAEVAGAVEVQGAQGIALKASTMQLGGPGGMGTEASMQGTFRLQDGDIFVGGVSFRNHVHDCPHGGTTGGPK